MKNLIRAEFLKIRTTRTVYWLFGAMLALVAFAVLATKPSLSQEGMDPTSLVNQEFLFLTGSITWLFVLVLALRSFTDEFRHGSIAPTLLANPDRHRVLLAKAVAVAATGLVFVVGAYAVALAVGVPRLGLGADTSIATVAMAKLLGKAALMSILWAALGVGVGLAVRHQVAAIVGSFVWIMFVESFLEGAAPAVAKYLPVHAWIAVIGPPSVEGGSVSNVVLGALFGGMMLAAWAAASIVGGAVLMQRRDIA
jgi:ABC-type transport system involved in multi-copper enzyme maturation permease subunit